MFNKSVKNTSYFILSGFLFLFVCALNYTTTIAACALVFSAITTVVSLITFATDKNKANIALFGAVALSMIILHNMQYYIHGQLMSNLVAASLVALYISVHLSLSIVSSINVKLDFKSFNFLAIVIAGALDAVMMSVFFALNNNFAFTKILSIATQEVSYKALYALAIYAFCALAKKSKTQSRVES
jgi:hypothetical protein